MGAKTLMMNGFVNGGSTTTANTDGFWHLSGHLNIDTTEANRDIKFQQAGTLSGLYGRVVTNSIAGTSTIITRKNAADGGQTLSIGSSATGVFEDTTGSDAVAAGDKLCLKFHPGAATNTMNLRFLSAIFKATTDTISVPVVSGPITRTTASTTWFLPLQGYGNDSITTETFQKCRMRKAGTIKKLGCYVSANRATNTTIRTRKNGANGNGLITITGGGASGWYEDTTNTDTVSAGEDWNYSITTGTGVDTLTIQTLKCEFNSTSGDGFTYTGRGTGTTVADATASYYPIGGTCDQNSTESTSQAKAREAFTLSNLEVMVSQNDVSSASTCDIRVGGASSVVTVSITGSLTGLFEDTTHSVVLVATDLINYRLNVPSVSGSHTVTLTNIGCHTNATASTDYTRAIDAETVSVSESLTRLLAVTRNPQETTSSTETLTRLQTLLRPITAESTTITDSVVRSKGYPRSLPTETVTSSDSITRMLAATRNPVETTTIDDPLARTLTLFRTIAESTTITDTINRVKELPRSIVETVTSSDSISRLLAATRAITESTTVSDSLSRMVGRIRAITENVIVSDTVSRLYGAIRAIATEVISITDSVARVITPAANNFVRSITETVTISDSVSRMLALTRVISETVNSSETLTRLLSAFRVIATEITTISDTVARSIGQTRTLIENLTISDSVTRVKGAVRTLTETVNSTDSISRLLTATRAISETISQSDLVIRLLTLTRSVSDTTVISDSVNRLVGRVRALTENVSISDSITRRFTGTRPITEIVDITDSLTRLLTRLSIPTKLHNLKEYIIAKYSISDPSL